MQNNIMIKNLCELGGISGNEDNVRDYIISQIEPYCSDITVDPLGSIIAFRRGKKSAKNKLMISAHMDEVGLIITNITEGGMLKFAAVGGIDNRVLVGKRVMINNVFGVIGAKPVHLMGADERKKTVDIDDMYIDIGATSKDEAKEYVSLGDSAVFYSKCDLTNGFVKSKAIDDRAGCAILIDMIQNGHDYDMTFVFNVQEEVGLRGATASAYSVNPDFAIVVETTTAADVPGVDDSKTVCNLGNGPVISFMDRSTIYDKELYSLALNIAGGNDIPCQVKRAVAGGNDSGAIHKSRGGVKTIAISLPCRNLHSQCGVINQEDYKNTIRLVNELANTIAGGY